MLFSGSDGSYSEDEDASVAELSQDQTSNSVPLSREEEDISSYVSAREVSSFYADNEEEVSHSHESLGESHLLSDLSQSDPSFEEASEPEVPEHSNSQSSEPSVDFESYLNDY